MTQYIAIPAGYLAWREKYAKEDEGKWITLNGGSGDEGSGGTPVKVDGQGNIVAGPKGLKDKGIEHVDHFADKGKQKGNKEKGNAGTHSEFRKTLEGMAKEHGTDRLNISDLRKKFPDMSREEFDQALMSMAEKGGVTLYRNDNTPSVTDEHREGMLRTPAGQERHFVYLNEEPKQNIPDEQKPAEKPKPKSVKKPASKKKPPTELDLPDPSKSGELELDLPEPAGSSSDLELDIGGPPHSKQEGLFGQVAQPTKGTGDKSQNTGTGKQAALFGKKGLAGQNNLFEDAGTAGKKVGTVETGKEFKYSGRPIPLEHYAEYEQWKQRYKENKEDGKWITLKANESAAGGAKVKVDDSGNILAGPSALGEKGVHNLKDFGDDEAQDRNRQKLEEGHRKIKREAREGKDRLNNQDRLDDAIDSALDEHPHLTEKALRDEIESTWKEASERIADRENAKAYARKLSGMNSRQIDQAEDRGLDHSGTGRMDEVARDLIEAYPDLQGEFGGHDGPSKVWSFIREGKQPVPPKHDESIVQQAASRLKAATLDFMPDDAETVPFSRAGEVAKYHAGFLAWKEKYGKT